MNNTDVPLVLFQPQMHVLTHAVETAQVGGTSQLPVTFRNLHAHARTHSKSRSIMGKTTNYEVTNKVHGHAQNTLHTLLWNREGLYDRLERL